MKIDREKLFNPVLRALHANGGSSTVAEIEDFVISDLGLTDSEVSEIHRGTSTKLNYQLRWARNYLKKFGVLANSEHGVWVLTPQGILSKEVDPKQVSKTVQRINLENKRDIASDSSETSLPDGSAVERGFSVAGAEAEEDSEVEEKIEAELTWKDRLLAVLKAMEPVAFERLCQRLLRELGFQSVEVTGRTGDGGIDGKGVYKVGGILSFHVAFQAKRYKDSVGAPTVRDFRGSLSANIDKGLIVTTGRFTQDARKESHHDGKLPIDLIDGDDLAEKLKLLKIGIEVRLVEDVQVNPRVFMEM